MVKKGEPIKSRRTHPARSPEEQEAYMVNLATKRAEEQLLDGTASSQVIVHYLKLGTMREKRELELLKSQNELAQAKIDALHTGEEIKALYDKAIYAMQRYSGAIDSDDYDDGDEQEN